MKTNKNYFLPILIVIVIFSIINPVLSQEKTDSTSFKKYSIDNCVKEFIMDKAIPTKVGYQFWFFDSTFVADGRTFKLSVVHPNSSTHPPHKHSNDEFIFILEGTAEFYLEGKTQILKPYTTFYCPPNQMHSLRNIGDTDLKYLVVQQSHAKK